MVDEAYGGEGKQISHAEGETSDVDTFLVDILLPNEVLVKGVRVARAVLKDADVLIGMDIITLGDFAVTNVGGKTKFSFQFPSRIFIAFPVYLSEILRFLSGEGIYLIRSIIEVKGS